MVQDGDEVFPGDILAKIPRETTRTKDITGGLPRVVELFEARKPRETAIISEDRRRRSLRRGLARASARSTSPPTTARKKEYSVPRGVHVNVQEGERLRAGEPLIDGPRNPHDILAVLGEKRAADVPGQRNPGSLPSPGRRHLRQAHRDHRPPDAPLGEDRGSRRLQLPARTADRPASASARRTRRVIANGGRPAIGRPLLLGITKASLSTESFISAASFQETTRVLTEASHQRLHRQPARPQGKRHRRPPHPRRNRHGVLPQRPALTRSWKKRQPRSSRKSQTADRSRRARTRNDAPWKAKPKKWPPPNKRATAANKEPVQYRAFFEFVIPTEALPQGSAQRRDLLLDDLDVTPTEKPGSSRASFAFPKKNECHPERSAATARAQRCNIVPRARSLKDPLATNCSLAPVSRERNRIPKRPNKDLNRVKEGPLRAELLVANGRKNRKPQALELCLSGTGSKGHVYRRARSLPSGTRPSNIHCLDYLAILGGNLETSSTPPPCSFFLRGVDASGATWLMILQLPT